MANIIHKTNAKRTVVDGKSFPSQLEANLYCHLKFLEKDHLVDEISLQERVELTLAKIAVKIDFYYFCRIKCMFRYAEAKGIETEKWQLIVRLWRHYGPAPLDIYKANRRGIYLAETINP